MSLALFVGYSEIFQKPPIWTYPTSIWVPFMVRWPRWNFAEIFSTSKLESLCYRMALFCGHRFSHLGGTPTCDRRTDGQADGHTPAGWLPVRRDQLWAQRSVTSMGSLFYLVKSLFVSFLLLDFILVNKDYHLRMTTTQTRCHIVRCACHATIFLSWQPGRRQKCDFDFEANASVFETRTVLAEWARYWRSVKPVQTSVSEHCSWSVSS